MENEDLKRRAQTMVYDTLGRAIHNNRVDPVINYRAKNVRD